MFQLLEPPVTADRTHQMPYASIERETTEWSAALLIEPAEMPVLVLDCVMLLLSLYHFRTRFEGSEGNRWR